MNIYNQKQLLRPSFFQRLLNKTPKENVAIEINNLLASNETAIENVSIDNIIEIGKKYKVNLKKSHKDDRINLFQTYLRFCLTDEKLEESELKNLRHIQNILLLKESDTKALIQIETEKLYEKHVKGAVEDGRLEDHEKSNLEILKKDLLLSEEVAKKLYDTNAQEIIKNFIDGAVSDERLSPDEEKEIGEIAKSLGIDLTIEEKSKKVLDRYKLYWQIENDDLPEIEANINLQKSEKLHYRTSVRWYEHRRVTQRFNYGGPTARIKIAKGVYYRMGSIKTQSISKDILQEIDAGPLYLTNKRLIFMGKKSNKTIGINKILDLAPYKNGIDIKKDSGKNPFLEFSNNVDIFSMMLVRIMDEQ